MQRLEVEKALAAWRDAERRLGALPEGSREYAAAQGEVERLRELYLATIDGAGSTASEPALTLDRDSAG